MDYYYYYYLQSGICTFLKSAFYLLKLFLFFLLTLNMEPIHSLINEAPWTCFRVHHQSKPADQYRAARVESRV